MIIDLPGIAHRQQLINKNYVKTIASVHKLQVSCLPFVVKDRFRYCCRRINDNILKLTNSLGKAETHFYRVLIA